MLDAKVPVGVAKSTPPSPPRPAPGFAPPPPPPTGWQPSPLDSARQQRKQRKQTPGVAPKSGCGCLLPILLLFAVPTVAGVIGVFGAVGNAVDRGTQDEGRLVIGQRGYGGIGDGDTDRWTLAGEDGEFRASVLAEDDFDPIVEVREIGGSSLGRDDDGGEDRDSQLDVLLERGQSYELLVTGFGSSSGDYHVIVEPVPVIPDVAPIDGGALTVFRLVSGEVPPGGSVRYRFTGEGREVAISVVGIDGFDPTVTVRTSDGIELGFDDDGGEEAFDSLLRMEIAGGQRVIVEVAGFGSAGGSYTLEVS